MFALNKLPKTATAPFCPSEVRGSVVVPQASTNWKKILQYVGPGLLVSVGYMDPGNWATDIESGSRYGYALLPIVVLSSLAAVLLQFLSLKLGIATGKDLAQISRDQYKRNVNFAMWILAEFAIIACDLAEVLGSALAFKLLLHCSLVAGVLLTAFDTVLILGLKGKGFRQVEAIVLGLVSTIALCYITELILVKPDWGLVGASLIPDKDVFLDRHSWYLAIGILGATVMPHNLYLHSSIVQTRHVGSTDANKREAILFSSFDTVASLFVALLVNAAILILAGSAFHYTGHNDVADIQNAHELLAPIVGTSLASFVFAIALLAAGQSSTFTGTIAGQVVMEGHLNLKIPCWQRRVITRGLALVPALIGVIWLGEGSVGRLLVLSQVCLSLQLPFAMYPLIKFTSRKDLMGAFRNQGVMRMAAWLLFAVITAANVWLIGQLFA